jgi:hypothetical protein
MRKAIAPIAITAALGGAFGAIAFGPSFAGAQDDSTTTTVQEEPADALRAPSGRIQDALSGLVDNGTLTQEQADAVTEALRDALPKGGRGHHILGSFDAAADYLGLSKEALREALQGEATLADVANGQEGKSAEALIAAMVADANTKIDEAVANGRIDEGRAAEMKGNLEERITSLVTDGVKFPRPEGGLRDRIRERLEGAEEDAS